MNQKSRIKYFLAAFIMSVFTTCVNNNNSMRADIATLALGGSEQIVATPSLELANEHVIVGYVTWWAGRNAYEIDPTYFTHLNYAFGIIDMNNFSRVFVHGSDRLRNVIMPLRERNPNLKILLCIGGHGTDGFSQMVSNETTRLAFAADCKRVIEEYGLVGIDINWEYPTRTDTRISGSPSDTENYTLMMRDIRAAIGPDKLLTAATAANARYIDFRAIDQYIDFINIMTYDLVAGPPFHNAALFQSPLVRWESSEEGVDLHIAAGIAPNKLTMGIPFYGRQLQSLIPSGRDNYVGYKDIVTRWLTNPEFTRIWDDVAKVPYLVNSSGQSVLSYEDEESIAEKAKFIRQRGLLGAMFWEYDQDDPNLTLLKALHRGMTE